MIYFVRAGSDGPVKIGFAEIDIAKRIALLQCGNHLELTLIRWTEGGRAEEAWLHRYFRSKRIAREWFTFDAEMEYIVPPVLAPRPGVLALRKYLADSGKSVIDFAGDVRVTTSAVNMWLRGDRFPRREVMARIVKATHGAVTANDFAEAA